MASILVEIPNDVLNIIFQYIHVSDKSCLRVTRTCSRLRDSILKCFATFENVDGTKFLLTADDAELCSIWPSRSLSSQLISLNISGLERIRGHGLIRLFIDYSFERKAEEHLINHVNSDDSKNTKKTSSLTTSLTSSTSIPMTTTTTPTPPTENSQFHRPTLSSSFSANMKQQINLLPSIISNGKALSTKLSILDVSMCSLLDPDLLIASLHGCPRLLNLNLSGCHKCLNNRAMKGIASALSYASTPYSSPLTKLNLSRNKGTAAVTKKVKTSTNNHINEDNYDNEELSKNGMIAIALHFPSLLSLSLNNHVKLSDTDIAPLFLRWNVTTVNPNPKYESSASTSFQLRIEELELCACARISSYMVSLLLFLFPLTNIQLHRCWKLDNHAFDPLLLNSSSSILLDEHGTNDQSSTTGQDNNQNGGGGGEDPMTHTVLTYDSFMQRMISFVYTNTLNTDDINSGGYGSALSMLSSISSSQTQPTNNNNTSDGSGSSGGGDTNNKDTFGYMKVVSQSTLISLGLSGCERLSSECIMKVAVSLPALKHLTISKTQLNDQDLSNISLAHQSDCNFLEEHKEEQQQMTTIKTTNSSSNVIKQFNSIHLNSNNSISLKLPNDQKIVFSGLETLNISKCEFITTSGLLLLLSNCFHSIETLNISDCPNINSNFLYELPSKCEKASFNCLSSLTNLNMHNMDINDSIINQLLFTCGASNLKKLYIGVGAPQLMVLSTDIKILEEEMFNEIGANEEGRKLGHCPNNHKLEPFELTTGGCGCNKCRVHFQTDRDNGSISMFGCRKCDYDLCPSCNNENNSSSGGGGGGPPSYYYNGPLTQEDELRNKEEQQQEQNTLSSSSVHEKEFLTNTGVSAIANTLGWKLEVLELKNHAMVDDDSILELMRKCPKMRRLLIPAIGISGKPLRALAMKTRCPELIELSISPLSKRSRDILLKDKQNQLLNNDNNNKLLVNSNASTLIHNKNISKVEKSFEAEWDTSVSLLKRKRNDIPKKTISSPGSQGRPCLGRWGTKDFQKLGLDGLGN